MSYRSLTVGGTALLSHDTDLAAANAARASPVDTAEPSADGLPVMSFADLMAHLGTLTRNTMRVPHQRPNLLFRSMLQRCLSGGESCDRHPER